MRKITFLSLVGRVALLSMLVASVAFAKVASDQAKRDWWSSLYKSSAGDPDRYQILNINNLWTWTRNDGISNHSPMGDNGLYFPRGTASLVYTDGIMWGGKVYTDAALTQEAPFGQRIRVGGANYLTGNREGHIVGTGAGAVASDPAAARIYRIRRDYASMSTEELARDAAESFEVAGGVSGVTDTDIQDILDRYALDWENWPVDLGAPYIDRDGDGEYTAPPPFSATFTVDDLIIGSHDEPGIAGIDPDSPADQVVWTVYNDLDREQCIALQGSEPMGLETQITVWGYKRTDALGSVMFRRARIINKGGVETDGAGTIGSFWIDSMYVAQWSDPDLGYPGDDLLGVDTTLSIGYLYNSNPNDNEYVKFNLPPPSVGYDFLQGPIVPSPGDTAVFDLKYIYGYKNLPMTSFTNFSVGSPISDPPRDYTRGTLRWYKMLRGYMPLDGPDEYFPYPPGIEPGPFPFSGDPVAGTGFIDGLGKHWSFAPGSRRLVISTGPFTLAPGDTQEVVVALVCGLGADRLSSISVMKYNDRFAQNTYDALFQVPSPPKAPIVSFAELDGKVILEWGSDMNQVGDTETTVNDPGGYVFEGYNVYQFPNRTATVSDAERIATYDLPTDPTVILDEQFDVNSSLILMIPVQFGSNSGILRFFEFDRDYVLDIDKIYNGQEYYLAVTAYSRATVPGYLPASLESAPTVLTVIPVGPVIGIEYEVALGDTIPHTHVAGTSDGAVYPVVIDPTALTGHEYEVTFNDLGDGETSWDLVNLTTGETLIAGGTNQSGDDDYLFTDGFQLRVVGAPLDFKSFQCVANAAGPLDPIEAAGIVWQGFPVPRDADPDGYITDNQQVGEGHWAIHTGDNGTRGSYSAFKSRSMRNDNFDIAVPLDWEMRFTAEGSYSYKGYEANEVVWVPFELWNIGMGTPDDPSDDYRLIPLLLEDIGGVVNNEYDLALWGDNEHSVSGGDNDPFTDWVYWELPVDKTPGESGYDAYVAALGGAAEAPQAALDLVDREVIARSVLVNWNGGSAPPFNQDLPEEGSIFRLITTKPITTTDVFMFSTTPPLYYTISKGDVNDDGSIDVADVVMIINFILQIEEPTGEQEYAADFNNDLYVNIADVVGIINDILGLSKSLAQSSDAENARISFPKQVSVYNDVVNVPLIMVLDGSVAGMQIVLKYDPQLLTPLSLKFENEEWNHFDLVRNSPEEGKVIYLFYSLDGETLPISNLPVFQFKMIRKEIEIHSEIEIVGAVISNQQGSSLEIQFGNKITSIFGIPKTFALYPNYPNPFNPITNITYDLPEPSSVTIYVYNILGQRVRTLMNREQFAGQYTIQWNGRNDVGKMLSSGVYIIDFKANNFTRRQKVMLLK